MKIRPEQVVKLLIFYAVKPVARATKNKHDRSDFA